MAIKEYIKNSHKPENVREYYINNHPHWPGLNPYIKFTPGIHSIYVGATGEMFPASTNYKEVLAPADINNPVYLKDILCENGELLFDGDITKFYIVADPEISGRFFINGANIGNIATNQDSPNIMVLDEEAVNKYEPRRYATEHSIKKSILHANIKYTYYDVTNTLQSGTVSSGTKALNEPYPWWGTTISWQSIPAVGYEFTGAESTYKGSIIAGTGAAVIEPTTSPTAKSYSVYKNATNGATITVNNTGTFDSALSISIGGLKSSSWLKSASITGPETTLNYGNNSYTMTGAYYTDITVNAEGNLMNLYNAASSATGVTITYPNYGEATVIRGDSTWNTSSDKFQFKLNEGYNFPITLTIKDNSTGTDYSNFSITAADCDYNSSTGVYTLKTPAEIINTSYVENTQIYTIAATRITWSPTVTLGTGVAKFVYSIDGTTWSSTEYTSGAGIVIDYADTCYVKASTASSGYVLENQSYATCTYSSQSVTVPKAAKFTVNVTRATGVATYSYSTNDGTSYTNGVTATSFTCPTGNTAKVKPYTASTNYTVDTTTVQLTATTPASITLVPATVPFYMDHRFEGIVFETTGPYSVAYNGTIEASDYIELTEFETPAYWYYNGSNTIVSGVKSEMTINIDWATRKVHTYTITWKYLSAYPSTWTATTETYNYNATPSRTGNNVTNSADNAREYFLQWDSLSNVTSDRTITGQYKRQYKLTFSGTRCTTDTKYLSGWYDNSETAFTYTWTAGTSSDRTNYAFDSGGTQKTATQSITPNQASIYSKSADYIYVKINSTNSTASIGGTAIDDGWRWVRYDIQCTWTATTNYAYSNSGLSTSSINLTEAGKDAYDSAPTHGYYTVSTDADKYTANSSTGWYEVTDSKTTRFTAKNDWSFNGSSANDYIDRSSAVPGGVSVTPDYAKITVAGSNDTIYVGSTQRDSNWSGVVALNTAIRWVPKTYYSFTAGTTQTEATSTVTAPATYANTPTCIKAASITGSYCDSISKNANTYYASNNLTITWTADNNHSFNGSAVSDTSTATLTAGGTFARTPSYVQINVESARCQANDGTKDISSGWIGLIKGGTRITWTADTGYSFADGTTQSATIYKDVSLDSPYLYKGSADYKYVTFSGTSCTAYFDSETSAPDGYRLLGRSFFWKADNNYAFDNTGKDTLNSNIVVGTTNYIGSANFMNITIGGTRCESNIPSGFHEIGATLDWDANNNCAFNSTGTQTTTSLTVERGVFNYEPTANYIYVNISAGTGCTTPSTTGWYQYNTKCTWTRDAGYAFDASGTTQAFDYLTTPGGSYSKTPTHCYLTINKTNCTCDTSSAWYKITDATSVTAKFTPNTNYSFSAGTEATTYTAPAVVMNQPRTVSASPTNVLGKITYTNCQVSNSIPSDTNYYFTNNGTITCTATDGYAYTTTATTEQKTWTLGCTLTSDPGYVKVSLDLTNCVYASGHANNQYVAKETNVSTVVNASNYWSFTSGATSSASTRPTGGASKTLTSSNVQAPVTLKASPNYCFGKIAYLYTTYQTNQYDHNGHAESGYWVPGDFTVYASNGYAWDSAGTTFNKVYSWYANCDITAKADYFSASVVATHCKATYLSTSSSATSGSPNYTYFGIDNTVYAFATLKDNTAQYYYTPKDTWTLITGRTYRVGSVTAASPNISVAANSNINSYAIKISAGANSKITSCSSNLTIASDKSYASGTVDYGAEVSATATANSSYAYDSNGTSTKGYSATVSGEITTTIAAPSYGYLNVNTTNCSVVENGAGWYALGKNIVTTYRASSDWSFGGSTLKDTTTTTTTVPNSVSASPGYCNVTINATNSKAKIGTTDVSGTTAIRALNTSITWTPNTYYSFSAGTDQTNTTATISGPGTYSKSPTNYRAASIASSSYCTPNRNIDTYYASGTTITWTAGSNYSFGGVNTGDTTTPSTTITAGGIIEAPTPGYMKATYSGTNVSKIYRVIGSGVEETMVNSNIYPVGTTIYWIASTATNTQYSFTNSSATSPTTSTSETLALNKLTYTHDANYVYYNVTITKNTNTASANYSSGYLLNGTTVTFTATENTTTKRYSYSNSTSATHTTSYNVSSAGQSISSPAVYIWWYVQISATNSTAHLGSATGTAITSGSSAWYINNQSITWTPANNYSFAEHSSTAQNTSATITSATALSKSPDYGYVTVTKVRCDGISTGYRAIGNTTFTANSNCAYNAAGNTTTEVKSVSAGGSIESSANYIKVTVDGSYCSGSPYTLSNTAQWVAYNAAQTWTPNTYYSYDGGTTQTSKTANLVTPGGTYSYSPGYAKVASIATGSYNASVNRNNSTYYAIGTAITWTAGSNYSYNGSSTGDTYTPGTTATSITAGANISAPNPNYVKATLGGKNIGSITWNPSGATVETAVSGNLFPVSAVIVWNAATATNTKYAFVNTGATWSSSYGSTTEQIALGKINYTHDANYIYYNVTINKGTNTASSNYASGYLLNGTTITFTTTAATSTKRYSYSSSSSTVNTENKTVSSAGQSITSDSVYIWMNCTFTGTNCSATNGWYIVGTKVTWTGDTGTNYKYSFTNTPVRNPSDAQRQTTSTVVEDTTSYAKTASYIYYNVNIAPATNCTANYTSGWGYFLNETTIKFTATTATDNVRYSFSTSSSTSYEVTSQVSSSVAGGNIASGTVYIWRYCTIGAKYSSTVLASQKQWYRDSTTCSSASYYNTDSYTDPRTTSEYNKKYYYTGKTTNSITVSSSATEVYTVYSTQNKINYTVSFTKASGSYGSWTVSSISAAWDAAISRSGDTITVGSSTNTYSGYNATGYTTTVAYTNDSGTVGTANKTITATTTRTGNTYTLTSTNNHCVVKYYSDSGYANQITQARYGSTIYVTVNPDSYYYWDIKANAHGNDYTAGGYTVTGTISGSNINIGTFTASPFSYTYSATSANGVCTPGTTNALTYGSNTSMSINPNARYYYSSTSYYHGVPYTYSNRPLTTANYTFSTSTADGTATATYVSACTAITYTYSISSANSAYCYHGKTQPSSANTTAQTGTYANRASTYVYYRINPASRYDINYNNQRGYNGSPIGDTSHYAVGSNFTFTDSNRTATLAINCTPITYTVTASLGNAGVQVGVSTNVYNTSLSKTYAELYTNNPSIYVKVTPNSHYGMTVGGTWYYNGNPLTGSSYYVKGNTFTFTDSNKTATCALSTSTYPISAIAYTASVSASNSNCTLGTASGSYSSTISLTYQSATIYLRQAPSEHYEVTYGSTRYYYGYNYTTNVNYTSFSFSDANKTATYALTGCSETTYTWTVSSTNSNYVYYNTTSNPSSAATISKKYSDNPTIYYKINAEDYYYCNSTSYPKGTPYSSSVNRGSFSFSYANKTAIFKKNCTSFTYTCKPTTVTGGTVSWNPATITAGGSSSWTITANTGYNTPSTYQGSVAWANFTKSTSTANGDATASNLPNCTRKSFTITLSGPNYGAWRTSNSTSGTAVTSQTAYYGDIITSSGNTLTCYRWDATSTARWTVYAVASATTAQYSYSTPTISGTSSDPITGSKTITAANTRTTRTYTVTFTAKNGSWSTTSIANVPYGTTWSTSGLTVTLSGSYGSSTYTKRATTVDYTSGDATITATSGTVQGATSISAVTATTARKYTIRWIGADGSTALETDSDVAYNATLTYNGSTPTKASTAQYDYTFSAWKLGSTSGSTVTSGTTKNPGSTSSTTINIYATFTSTVRSYNVTIKKGGTTAAISSGTYQVDSGSATAISWGNAFTVKYGSYVKNVSATASASSPAISSLTAPKVAQSTGDYSGTKVRVTNNNSLQVTCYYGTSSGSTTNSTTISASSSKEITGLTAGTTYYFFFRVVKTNYAISSYDPSAASGSTGVQITGTTTITVNGSSSTQNINSSNVSCQPVAKKVPLHMEYYYEGVKLFTDTYNNYDYNSFVDTTVLLIPSYKSGAYEYGDPRHNNPSQTEIDPLTTETTVVINYTTRTTAYYNIIVQAKYNGSVFTSQTVSKTYNSSISSTSYYGTSYNYGGYSYTGGSGQSITVTGDATIATTYSNRSYRSYTLNQGTHTNCTFSKTTGSYNTAKSLSFSPATGYGYPITYSVGTSSGSTNLKSNTKITSGTGTYTMNGTYYSNVYVNCTATAKTYNINAGTLSGVSFSATTGTYGVQKTLSISLQSSYGYPVSWSLKNGSTTVASGTLNSSTDSIKYTMNSNYYSSLSLNATATSTAFSWIPYGDWGSWGSVWDFIQDQTLGSSRAYYKTECAWVSEARTYNVNRADLDSSAASSDAFNSWLESEGYFWADTVTTRDAFIADCTDMSDAGYFNFAFILEGGTGNDPIRIFLTK